MARLKLQAGNIPLSSISVFDSDDALPKLLRAAIRTGGGIHHVRFSRSTINGQFIEDALVYRIL